MALLRSRRASAPASFLRTIVGTNGNDRLVATADGDRLLGLGGDDVLESAFNRTGLFGGTGDDVLTTRFTIETSGPEAVEAVAKQSGGAGDDTLLAETEAFSRFGFCDATARNVLDGGAGHDSITGRAFVFGSRTSA